MPDILARRGSRTPAAQTHAGHTVRTRRVIAGLLLAAAACLGWFTWALIHETTDTGDELAAALVEQRGATVASCDKVDDVDHAWDCRLAYVRNSARCAAARARIAHLDSLAVHPWRRGVRVGSATADRWLAPPRLPPFANVMNWTTSAIVHTRRPSRARLRRPRAGGQRGSDLKSTHCPPHPRERCACRFSSAAYLPRAPEAAGDGTLPARRHDDVDLSTKPPRALNRERAVRACPCLPE